MACVVKCNYLLPFFLVGTTMVRERHDSAISFCWRSPSLLRLVALFQHMSLTLQIRLPSCWQHRGGSLMCFLTSEVLLRNFSGLPKGFRGTAQVNPRILSTGFSLVFGNMIKNPFRFPFLQEYRFPMSRIILLLQMEHVTIVKNVTT